MDAQSINRRVASVWGQTQGLRGDSHTKEKSRTWGACAPFPARFDKIQNRKEDAMLKEQMKQNQIGCQPK